jgi:hypothetical protein
MAGLLEALVQLGGAAAAAPSPQAGTGSESPAPTAAAGAPAFDPAALIASTVSVAVATAPGCATNASPSIRRAAFALMGALLRTAPPGALGAHVPILARALFAGAADADAGGAVWDALAAAARAAPGEWAALPFRKRLFPGLLACLRDGTRACTVRALPTRAPPSPHQLQSQLQLPLPPWAGIIT